MMSRGQEARRLMRRHRSGVLSSHSAKFSGYPYGSALPHITDHRGRPVLLISHLAEHTHNLDLDAHASYIVCDSGPELQAHPRATLLGQARVVDDAQGLQERYLRFYPEQEQYLQIGGFRFYAIEPAQVRYIHGFGGLHWIPGESYLAAENLEDAETSIVEHMNEDHIAAMRDYCRLVHERDAQEVEMVGIDCDGFDVRADGSLLRFDFGAPIGNPGQVRNALIELAQRARARK